MEKEKKEIKISLWTFYVLVAAIVVLIGAVVIGGMGVARKNQLELGALIYEVSNDGYHHVYNDYYDIVQNICVDFLHNEALEAKQKSVHKNELITLEDIDNETKVAVAYASVAFNNFGSDGYIKVEEIKANKIEKKVQKIFGKNVTVEHQDIPFYGVVYENGKYIPTEIDEEVQNTFEYNPVYSEIVKAVYNGDEIIVYEEYVKEVYNEQTSTRDYYATTDMKIQLATTSGLNNYGVEPPVEVKPLYKHTLQKGEDGKYKWVSSELVNENELKVVTNINSNSNGTENNQLPQSTDNKSENIILYNGYELKVRYDEEIILEDMEYTSENIEIYEKSYYNYENGKYIGITNGIVEESFEGYCTVSNVSKFALSQQYNAMPRTARLESKFKYSQGDEYANKSALVVDLDGDGKEEYIVALSSNEYPHKSEIIILDYNLNKMATLVKRDKGHWVNYSGEESEINVLSLEDVELIDLDNDNIIEIVVDTMVWDCTSVLIYKYENGAIKGVTNFNNELTI